jgi:radical SAM protein with 4Fe4S-binding SPASM domain
MVGLGPCKIHPILREQYPLRALPGPHSLVVRMDITNKCNLDCVQCTLASNRIAMGESSADMPLELFGRIADQLFPSAEMVQLSCEAEPTMHQRFREILEIVGRHRGTAFIMTTNGTLLPERTWEAIFNCNMAAVTISIDGATAATFQKIRRRGHFDRVVQTIELMQRLKAERGRSRDDYPRLMINYTLMRSTLDELPAMVDLCIAWNVHRLTLQHLYAVESTGLHAESLVHDRAHSDAILRACKARCDAHGILTTFPILFDPDPPPAPSVAAHVPEAAVSEHAQMEPSLFCYAPWRMMRVRWSGEVHPCDLWGSGGIGDFRNQSLEEIWSSPEYVQLRWDHLRRQPSHHKCINCTMVTTDNLEGKAKKIPLVLTPDA